MSSATIAAIATPPGRGGIGIVRVSGTDLRPLIEGMVGRELPPRVATHVAFRDASGATIDEGIALYFHAPHSYTGEDVVEWQGHGGIGVMRLLLARCAELGARLAEPGEFTRRAFLNGRLDLVQAESVADVIEASTATAVRAAARSLTGEFSREVQALRDALVELRMHAEAVLDFPDEEVSLPHGAEIGSRVAGIRERLGRLLGRARGGAVLRHGLCIVLVGAPNVGKSSLLNRLVGEDAAIVTPIPGTTRDSVERQIEIAGIPITVVDTAGLRATDDEVERHGIARTRIAVQRADLALVLVDARDDRRSPGDRAARCVALADELPPSLPRIVVHNKSDLAVAAVHVERHPTAIDASQESADARAGEVTHVWLCALTGEGVPLLEEEMLRVAGAGHAGEDAFLARARHVEALDLADRHLQQAMAHVTGQGTSLELFAEELRGAQSAFSAITGEFTADDLLGEIFSRFCIGK